MTTDPAQARERIEATALEITGSLLARMRKTTSGVNVAFDSLHVSEVIGAALADLLTAQASSWEARQGRIAVKCLTCGEGFNSYLDLYRCVDCEACLHRDCAKVHFNAQLPPKHACAVLAESAALRVKFQQLTNAIAHGAEISGWSFEQIVALASAHAEDSGIVVREVLEREAAEAKLEAAEQALRNVTALVDELHAAVFASASRGEG